MAPPNPPPKKRKLDPKEQIATQVIVNKLAALNVTITSTPKSLALELISPLKCGIGLVGNIEEEQAYYQLWVDSQKMPPNSDEQDQANTQAIGGADSDETQPDEDAADEDAADEDDADEDAADEDAADEERTLQIYRPKKKNKRQDNGESSDEELGDYETLHDRQDFFIVDGEPVHADAYLGDKWKKNIRDLYDMKPVEHPSNMNVTLHHHQLKGAAQMDHLCRSRFRGGILADGMGVGKTFTAIQLMYMVKGEPGFSMVVCPKSLCLQWVADIENAWEEGFGMRAYHLESSSMTAHELLALGVDVIVCSFDQVVASERARRDLPGELEAYSNDQEDLIKKPKRPIATLHSSFWEAMDLPIKRLILDEAQLVNKRQGVRHQSLKRLHFKAVVLLTGTPAHNKWFEFSGLVDFLQGHPFTTHRLFMKAFSSNDYDGKIDSPDLRRVRLLQRFLQAFTIARPSSILKLEKCTRSRLNFPVRAAHLEHIELLFSKYQRAQRMSKDKKQEPLDNSDDAVALKYAVQAQMASMHPMLCGDVPTDVSDNFVDMDENDPVYGYVATDKATKGGEDRDAWLERVRNRNDLIVESDRLLQFLAAYAHLRKCNPTHKILVVSQYLKFLDIIAEALKREFGIDALRYDGRLHHTVRRRVEQEFRDCHPGIPLLMTAGAGAYGINVTAASVIIQTEIWWNLNVEWQAICRIWRQLQESEVLAIQIFASNSPMDKDISKVQTKKSNASSELMKAIIRHPDDGPDIQDLLSRRYIPPPQYEEYEGI